MNKQSTYDNSKDEKYAQTLIKLYTYKKDTPALISFLENPRLPAPNIIGVNEIKTVSTQLLNIQQREAHLLEFFQRFMDTFVNIEIIFTTRLSKTNPAPPMDET